MKFIHGESLKFAARSRLENFRQDFKILCRARAGDIKFCGENRSRRFGGPSGFKI
ncbi:MAG: hypothetical protein KH703_07325 [Campylobacter gracilis]|uniref:hypothetical protein n=1 Tax=Campylobacter gracilis TaxID=824 RepID=UPI0026EB8770|nr:hypothetical protein [Campylobacter gracilis]MBS6153201.1 hypothetical protein [Campylobacter gracilis]